MLYVEIVFLLCVGVIAGTFAGLPALVWLRSRLCPRPVHYGEQLPCVSLIVCCYNEEEAIAAKIENLQALNYPAELLEIIIASDGSTDRTAEIVRECAGDGIRLMELPRGGKAVALNKAVAVATKEILVFSDANSMYAADAIRQLVRGFADQEVGGVAGNQVYLENVSNAGTEAGERSYWNFDRWLKLCESRAGNVVSATGAIYAVRRSLFQPVPDGVTDDFVTSTRVIAQGKRLIFEPAARCYEPVAQGANKEFGRKTRITTRGLRGVIAMRGLLNPLRYGFYAIQLWLHKVLRRLVVFPLVFAGILAPLLWHQGICYRVTTLLEAAFLCLAGGGWVAGKLHLRVPKICALPCYFCMVNLAVVVAVWNILRGQRITVWNTQRGSAATEPVALMSGVRQAERPA